MIVVGLMGFAGGLSLLGALLNWSWFMNSRRAQFFVRTIGYNGARILYIIIGGALLGFAIYGAFHPEILHSRRHGIG